VRRHGLDAMRCAWSFSVPPIGPIVNLGMVQRNQTRLPTLGVVLVAQRRECMTAPILMNAVQIAWIRLLRDEQIDAGNIETAPLLLLATIMEAAGGGEENPAALAEIALRGWRPRVALH